MKPIPQLQKFMTTVPFTIESTKSVAQAADLMKRENIRHLPVMEEGEVIGLISDRDIKLYQGLKGVDLTKEQIKNVSIKEPYTVTPDTNLDVVCAMMAEKKYGCALVKDNGHLVGIFTWVDALKAMHDLFETRLKG